MSGPATEPEEDGGRLLEIWGDTVDSRHTIWAIALGVGLTVPLYLGAELLFSRLVDDATVAGTYALLVGLVGCLLAGFVGALLFAPKRVVTEHAPTEESRRAAMDAVEADYGPLGDPSELSEPVRSELRALGLYDDLLAQHRRREEREAP
ncbi:hypothetical protein KGD82_14830 [Nocardiopsis eucommiae]|uniref:Uncharacterized protein n=2 Tax=Nocardiopsis TaxID=2013 RepID=A0A975LDN3_9ACTN|nr:hypothetical protein KGD82_14830 [Nocardiopsis eucommiae]